MSAAVAFDSHRFVKSLTASGFTEAQAEALAHEQIHLLEVNLATKSDLGAVKSDLEVKIAEVKAELEVKIEQVRAEVQTVKSDLEIQIETVRSGLEFRIEKVRADLEVKIEKVRADLARWMLTGWVAQTGVLATLIWYFSAGMPGG
ncbi:MAG: DUF1640 domain-containing protein [Proteobacteria bacterium]|nr:DUF1640 domain-containing protein [Pseudomonadota bacterium]